MSLPLFPTLSEAQQDKVATTLSKRRQSSAPPSAVRPRRPLYSHDSCNEHRHPNRRLYPHRPRPSRPLPHPRASAARARRLGALYPPRPHLADLLAEADLAIGAGGTTTWERCCLGLPSLVVSIAENQRPACKALAAAGVIAYLGHQDGMTTERLRDAIQTLLDDAQQRQRLSAAGAALVYGSGARRASLAMQRFPTTRMP